MARRPGREERTRSAVDALHTAAGAVLGAADRLESRATRRHAEAMVELWLREPGLAAARDDPALRRVFENPELAGVVRLLEAERDAAFARWGGGSPEALSALVADAAPGAAGQPPDRWLGRVGTAGTTDVVPELWQVGTGTVAGGAPFRVGLPLLDGAHLQITSSPGTRDAAESLVETLLLRVMSHVAPGVVDLHVWDVGQLAGALPGLQPLTRTGLLAVHDPSTLESLLARLAERIRRVHARVLARGYPSLRAAADAGEGRPEPWLLTVLVGNRQALPDAEYRQLQRVARGGLASGVVLVLVDVPAALPGAVETVTLSDPPPVEPGEPPARAVVRTSMTGPHVEIRLDEPVDRAAATTACHAIADEHEQQRGRLGEFADLLPRDVRDWGQSSATEQLFAPVGFEDGTAEGLTLDDSSPHALVGGPSGSGKTNLLLGWITSLAAHYSPDDLELYLLDFKEGVSFAQFAPGHHADEPGPDLLPHARLIGVNVNTDREFGLALLHHLAGEMRRRAEAAKRRGVTKLAELRGALEPGSDERWPRIVAVIDEFQFLFAEKDTVTAEATALLEDLARRGRSQGIHLVFASQDVSGIEAFWGRPAIFEQFVLRIALPRARRVLANLNEAAMELPRWHAVVNHESGVRHANRRFQIPEVSARALRPKLEELSARWPRGSRSLVVFDGALTPTHDELAAHLTDSGPPQALLGKNIDIDGSPATVPLPDVPGRNLAVLSAGSEAAVRLLCSATDAIGLHRPDVRFVFAPLVAEAAAPVEKLSGVLADRVRDGRGSVETVGLDGFAARITELAALVTGRHESADRSPVLLVVYAVDAAEAVLDRAGTDALRTVLHYGPETGVHVLGWWRSVSRLRALLTGLGVAGPEDVGAWVALDVPGPDLGPMTGGLPPAWRPAPGRALVFDRAQHARPQVVIAAEWPV